MIAEYGALVRVLEVSRAERWLSVDSLQGACGQSVELERQDEVFLEQWQRKHFFQTTRRLLIGLMAC